MIDHSASEGGICPTILLAEDDRDLRAALAEGLRNDGYSVIECRDGVELLSHLACVWDSKHPKAPDDVDAIVSDIRMPGINGLSILEGVRQYDSFPPMILITAFGDDETHAMAKRHGAAAILDKPFDLDDLLERLHEIVAPCKPR